MMKKEITQEEYLQIKGLLLLAHEALKQIEYCEKAYIKLVDFPEGKFGDSGHFGDAIWNNGNIENVLKNEKINIIKSHGTQKHIRK